MPPSSTPRLAWLGSAKRSLPRSTARTGTEFPPRAIAAAVSSVRGTRTQTTEAPAERPECATIPVPYQVSRVGTGRTGRSRHGAPRRRSPRGRSPGGGPRRGKERTRGGHRPGRPPDLTAPALHRRPSRRPPGRGSLQLRRYLAGNPSAHQGPTGPPITARHSRQSSHSLRRRPRRPSWHPHHLLRLPRRLLPRPLRPKRRPRSHGRRRRSTESARRPVPAVARRLSDQPRSCARRWQVRWPAPRLRGRSYREGRRNRRLLAL